MPVVSSLASASSTTSDHPSIRGPTNGCPRTSNVPPAVGAGQSPAESPDAQDRLRVRHITLISAGNRSGQAWLGWGPAGWLVGDSSGGRVERDRERGCGSRSGPASDRDRRVIADLPAVAMSAERDRVETFGRLEDGLRQAGDWYLWGPYLSERQWGTVREDYSPGGTAWDYLPHDHARSRAYRWGEDGLAGFSDIEQRLCLGLALWNGRDPILKERIFGLTGSQGNHGEDAKEYWWYLDALPSHAWNRWRYHYPQGAFPYDDLVAENGRRGKLDPEYELLDTGAFDDDRYWIVEADYAKGDPHDLLLTVRVTNAGPRDRHDPRAPDRLVPEHLGLGRCRRGEAGAQGRRRGPCRHRAPVPRRARAGRRGRARRALLRERDERRAALRQRRDDGDAEGRHQRPRRRGRRDGARRRRDEGRVLVPPRGRAGARRRPFACACARPAAAATPGTDFDETAEERLREADEFYAELTPAETSDGRGARAPAGAGRDAVEQAALRLRRRALARRRPRPAETARLPAERAEHPLAHLRRLRHHVDARQVGVPVVRRLGPRLPLRRARARRPGLRQVPADPALPGVVPAPERRARRLRVVVRRRQPAGPGLGRARGVRDRRRRGHRLPRAGLRQAARQLHLVGEPRGPGRLERVRGRLPRSRQHRAARPLAPPGGLAARAVRRHRLDGLLRPQHGGDRVDPEQPRPPGDRPRPEVPRALRADLGRARVAGPLGRGRRLLLRPAAPARRRRGADPRALDRRGAAAPRGRRDRREGRRPGRDGQQARGRHAPGRASGERRARRPAHAARRRRRRAGAAAPLAALRRAGVPLAITGSGRSRASTPSSRSSSTSRACTRRSTTSRPSRRPGCSAATRTGGARSGCPSTSSSSRRSRRYARFFGDELKVEYPTGSAERAHARGDRRRPPRAADVALPRRRRRQAAVLRLGRAAPAGRGLEGQHPLQRVLPRRQRRRARREPPDGLDGPRRRADPPRQGRRGADARAS